MPQYRASIKGAMKTINVFKQFTLTLASGVQRAFAIGVHEIEAELASHWFVKAHSEPVEQLAQQPPAAAVAPATASETLRELWQSLFPNVPLPTADATAKVEPPLDETQPNETTGSEKQPDVTAADESKAEDQATELAPKQSTPSKKNSK